MIASTLADARIVGWLNRYARARLESTGGKPPGGVSRAVAAVVVAALVVLQATAPVAAVAASTPGQGNGPPSGMVGVPNAAVSDKIPDHAQGQVPDASAFRGSVMTDAHADTLAVEVTTRAAAQGRANACKGNGGGSPPFCSDPTLALNVSDDVNHDGRRVAVPKDVLGDALGYEPTTAQVVHESGREYEVPVRERGSLYVFDLDGFSTNTVTFTGEVELSGDPATDGATYVYDFPSLDAASNPDVTLTGVVTTENETQTGTLQPGGSASVPIAGNKDPINEELTLTAQTTTQGINTSKTLTGSWSEYTFDNPPERVSQVAVAVHKPDEPVGTTFSMELVTNGNTYTLFSSADDPAGGETKVYSADVDAPTGSDAVVRVKSGSDGNNLKANWARLSSGPAQNVDVTFSDGSTASFGDFSSDGETKTRSVDLSRNVESFDLSGSGSPVSWSLSATERSGTDSVGIRLNGNWTNVSGPIPEGETVNRTLEESSLQSGTNQVYISVGDGSLSADAPTPAVGLEYAHDARDEQTVGYQGETWSERYNVSREWGDGGQNATVEIPFAGNVVSNRDLRVYVNGTETAPTYSEYDGTALEVGLGDLDPQTKTRVVANGSKVVVANGSIQVLEPTTEGNDLDTRFRVTSADDGFRIDVSGTASGDRVHYLHNATWTPASDHVRVENAGAAQYLHVPNASAGSTATARTLPLSVAPQNDVELAVADATEPKFKLRPGRVSGDAVDLTYYDTESGTEYQLLDEDNDKIAASDTAESPVHFAVDSDEETIYSITVADSSESTGDGGGGSGRDRSRVTDIGNEPLASPIVMIVVAAAVILVGAWVASRTGLSARWVAGVGVLVALGTLETLRPGTVTGPVEDFLGGASDVAPVLWLAAGGMALLTVYGLYSRYGKPPRIMLNRGGR